MNRRCSSLLFAASLVLALVAASLACSRSAPSTRRALANANPTSPAPSAVSSAAPSTSAPATSAAASTSAPASSTSIPDDLYIGSGLPPPLTRALGERLAREADAIPPGTLRLEPPADPERDGAIHARFGKDCSLERTCGPLWGIDCGAAADGPYYYVRPRLDGLHEITTCGGACMGGRCKNCPPKNEGWTCAVY